MVETDQAKKMGYAEFNVCKKLRKTYRSRDSKSTRVFRELKTVLNKNDREGSGEGDHDHESDRDRDRDRDSNKDRKSSSSKKKSSKSSKKQKR